MARSILGLRCRIDVEDLERFEAEVEDILHRYGDQPHLRARRDAELEQACSIIAQCVQVELVTHDG